MTNYSTFSDGNETGSEAGAMARYVSIFVAAPPLEPQCRSRLLPCWPQPQPVPRIFAQVQGASLSVRLLITTTTTVSHRVFDPMLISHVMADQKEGAAPKEEARPL